MCFCARNDQEVYLFAVIIFHSTDDHFSFDVVWFGKEIAARRHIYSPPVVFVKPNAGLGVQLLIVTSRLINGVEMGGKVVLFSYCFVVCCFSCGFLLL